MSRVHFLGTGDAFGSGGRLQTCILVEDDGWRVLIDCGASCLVGLKRAGIDPASIDAIVISHLHGDHFAGLPFYLLDAQLNSRRATQLVIAGHADLEERLRATMELLFPGSQRALEVVETAFVSLTPGESFRLGPAAVEVYDVEHFCGSPPYAVRLTTPSGDVVAYSGDTEWTDTLIDVAADADLFVAEAYFFDKPIRWHLDYATLAGNLSRLTARQTIATHLSADMLSRTGELAVPVANDGLVVEL
ncbi:MAG: MBL fold metallo-hydrolase [Acidimicrobiia bacterium]|nr:MBL fold metallo-hydrolase [Acidimicrobiia bacterium]